MIKPGSLVVYIGGQTPYDVECGYGLQLDAIYEVMAVGTRFMNGRKEHCIEIVEMPNVSHMTRKFREVQPPGTINFEELLSHPLPKKDTRTGEDELAEQKGKAETKARPGSGG